MALLCDMELKQKCRNIFLYVSIRQADGFAMRLFVPFTRLCNMRVSIRQADGFAMRPSKYHNIQQNLLCFNPPGGWLCYATGSVALGDMGGSVFQSARRMALLCDPYTDIYIYTFLCFNPPGGWLCYATFYVNTLCQHIMSFQSARRMALLCDRIRARLIFSVPTSFNPPGGWLCYATWPSRR